ncbi:MAG: hypothetical protein A6F72_08845 [Cycloclasticus sp. symbiont of Poecilosclerida sp. N]|nr:MAG: hypothetical protein A6F72_08845 [Cycloclasticus sp. symbiont of Poecilosclerida sp. N]
MLSPLLYNAPITGILWSDSGTKFPCALVLLCDFYDLEAKLFFTRLMIKLFKPSPFLAKVFISSIFADPAL